MPIKLNMTNGSEVQKYFISKLIINNKLTNDKLSINGWIDRTINNVIHYIEIGIELQVWMEESEMKRAVIDNEKTISIDPKRMFNLEDRSIRTSDGCNTIIKTKLRNEFAGKAIHLSNMYEWIIAKDSYGETVLIPLKK